MRASRDPKVSRGSSRVPRDSRTSDQFDVMMMRCHTQDEMVHLIASLDGPMIEYINKMLERGEGRGEKGEGREERGGRERSSDGDKEGRFTSTEQGLRVD